MEAKLFGGGFKHEVALKFDCPLDAAAFRKVVGLHEYSNAELEDSRRAHASSECPNKLGLAYLATFILQKPTSLPEFDSERILRQIDCRTKTRKDSRTAMNTSQTPTHLRPSPPPK
eukprot:707249-Prymnesium_polylepis.2